MAGERFEDSEPGSTELQTGDEINAPTQYLATTPRADSPTDFPEPGGAGPGHSGPSHSGPGYSGPGYSGPGYSPPGYSAPSVTTVTRRSRRRRRRQTLTFAVFFLLIAGVGFLAYQAYLGNIDLPISSGKPTPLPSCPTGTPTSQAFGATSVNVFNASTRNGLALSVARELQKRGFRVPTTPSNDPAHTKVTTLAVIRHGARGELAARAVASVVDGRVTLVRDERIGQDVDLVLGASFKLKAAPARATAAASSAPSPTCIAAAG